MATATKTTKKAAPKASKKDAPEAVAAPRAAKAKVARSEKGEFAVIHTGGKQYVVAVGDSVKIETLQGEFNEGDTVTFKEVIVVDDGASTTVGAPYVAGASVTGTLEKIGRHPKIDVVHYKQKSRYYKKAGHRQPFFQIRITGIK